MLKNYFINTFRYLRKHPLSTGINLFGLAIGIGVCFFALIYIRFELSYDTYHTKADQIYRLVTDVKTSSGISYENTSAPMAPLIQSAFSSIEASTRVLLDYLMVQNRERRYFKEEPLAYADPSLFSVFTLPLISGEVHTALEKPFSIVLSETAARRYFGTTDCLGETLILDESPAVITGVMKDMPYNSHFRVDMLVSMSTLLEKWNPAMNSQWARFGFYTYLLLSKDCDTSRLEHSLTDLVEQHIDQRDIHYQLLLEPLTNVYLQGKTRGSRYGSSVRGDINNIYIFALVAAFVLFIACFNFVNISTALSMYRAKEIGVRKVLGATRRQLLWQVLLDAVLLSLIALALAILLSALFLPAFNQLAGKIIRSHIFEHVYEVVWLVLGTCLVGLLSGIYPAVFLSGFPSIQSLQGNKSVTAKRDWLRKTLIVLQFSVSAVLMTATMVVYRQLNYMQNHALGFDKQHKLVVDFHFDKRISDHLETIKQQLTAIPGIERTTFSSSVPGKANRKYFTSIENADSILQEFQSDVYFVDYDFLSQYQIGQVAGRSFSKDMTADSTEAMLINEAAVRSLGYAKPEAAIGKRFEQHNSRGWVIGVVEDFHFHSLKEEIQPLTLRITPGWNLYTFMTLNIYSSDIPATIRQVENLWSAWVPGKPMSYFFVDDAYHAQYLAEERFGKLFTCFALLALLIACLGLLGLSVFSANTRTQEIGIRKVLGASVSSILFLLSKDYIKLILIALLIAVPVANYLITEWLQDFAYRIAIEWWLFALPGALVLLIALLSVSGQTLKAARQNPVDSLRSE